MIGVVSLYRCQSTIDGGYAELVMNYQQEKCKISKKK